MMLRNQPQNESVPVFSALHPDDVASNAIPSDSATDRIPSNCLRGTNGRGNEGGLHESGWVSRVHRSSVESFRSEQEGDMLHEEKGPQTCHQKTSKVPQVPITKDNCQFSEPTLLTSLKVIESLHSLSKKCVQAKSQPTRDPQISKKAARKVNIPFEEKIYKDLIDLQVNDVDLGFSSLPYKPKEIVKVKDPVPILSDYFKPKFNKEYVIKPSVVTFEITNFTMPELPSVYEKTKSWEPEDLS